jgi:ferric-dicitrate binding protein FerR (iron transport regulator)
MHETIIRVLHGRATPQEVAEVDFWRAASAANESEYQEIALVVAALRRTAPVARPVEQSAADLIGRARQRRVANWKLWSRWVPWGIAAAASMIATTRWQRSEAPSAVTTTPSEATEVMTGENELATVRMPDGSVARLAPRSRIRVMSSSQERVVWLTGRAFLAVSLDPRRPFRVRTAEGDVLALGTRFDVDARYSGLRVAVLEGRVAVYRNGKREEVDSGEVTAARSGARARTAKLEDPMLATRWTRQFLAFQATPLSTVALEIERVYGKRVVIADTTLANQTVTATFTDESLEKVVQVVCTVVGVFCQITDTHVSVSH